MAPPPPAPAPYVGGWGRGHTMTHRILNVYLSPYTSVYLPSIIQPLPNPSKGSFRSSAHQGGFLPPPGGWGSAHLSAHLSAHRGAPRGAPRAPKNRTAAWKKNIFDLFFDPFGGRGGWGRTAGGVVPQGVKCDPLTRRNPPGAPLWGAPKRVKTGLKIFFFHAAVRFLGCVDAPAGRPLRGNLTRKPTFLLRRDV